MKPPVLFSGATGFLGAEVARQLSARGHRVHALAREGSDRSGLDGVEITWHAGDLRDPASIDAALAKVCAGGERPWFVHAGASISYRARDRALAHEVNVEGTRHVLAALRRHPVGRVLHVSSVVAVGPAEGTQTLNEDSVYDGERWHCDYMSTKHLAEELAREASGELDLVIVNPGAIFGASPRSSNTQRVLRMVATGRTGPFPRLLAPPGAQSVVGLEDCARGCVLALERGARGRRYLLVESVWSHRDLIAMVARRCGQRAPIAVPRAIWACAELAGRLFEPWLRSEYFTAQTLRLARARFATSGARARAELGWDPLPLETVIEQILAAWGITAAPGAR